MITHRNIHENYKLIISGATESELTTELPKYSPETNDLWLDTTNNKLMRYNGSAWVDLTYVISGPEDPMLQGGGFLGNDGDGGTEWQTGHLVRNGYCAAAAGSGSTISCYLDTDGQGDTVTVNCELFEATDLSDCYPTLTDGQLMPVYYDGTNWRSMWAFFGTESCS